MLFGLFAVGCSFSEYAQSESLTENIDDYRTGCEVDADSLIAGYKQYDANRYYIDLSFGVGEPDPTPTPSPIDDDELATKIMLERVWENGCKTGRRDAVGAERATLMGLRDQLDILEGRLSALETPTPVPTPSPTR